MTFLQIPFFNVVADAETILILLASARGGFDIFSGLPLDFGLKSMGKTVHLANLSFSLLHESNGKRLGTGLVQVTAQTKGFER